MSPVTDTDRHLAFQAVETTLAYPLFKVGTSTVTLGSLLAGLVALLLLIRFSRWLSHWLLDRVFPKTHLDLSSRQTFATLIRYCVLVFGVMTIFQTVGVSLSSFTVLIGALGVGVGFGLQNIFSNFISGLIVMFERPIKIGDHISVAGAEGDVIEIGARATTLITAQHTKVIVPNQALITGNVINWDVETGKSSSIVGGLRIPDTSGATENAILDAIRSVRGICEEPAPHVLVTAFDAAGLTAELHFWVTGDPASRMRTTDAVTRAVHRIVGATAPKPAG